MKAIFKLVGGGALAFLGYEAWGWYRKSHATTPLVPGHGYTVVLAFKGAGAGGAIDGAQLQAALDAGPAGPGGFRVTSSATDPSKKTITYQMGVMSNVSAPAAMFAPTNFPAPWGPVVLDSVHDVGIMAVGQVATS